LIEVKYNFYREKSLVEIMNQLETHVINECFLYKQTNLNYGSNRKSLNRV